MNPRFLLTLITAAWASLLMLSSALYSQQESPSAGTASISGRVTIGKEPAAGVLVAAQRVMQGESIELESVSAQVFTDSDGSFNLTGLKAGTYTVKPLAVGFINKLDLPLSSMEKTRPEKTLHLGEGDRVGGVDFTLSMGGVISGRITDTESWPVAGKQVRVTSENEKRSVILQFTSHQFTDDRGMYRLFGVPPGLYRVSVGEISSNRRPGRSHPLDQPMPVTYYPGVPDPAQATVVEVTEGRETSGIDFKVPRWSQGYRITGFMQEAESRRPVSNQRFMISQVDEKGRARGSSNIGVGGGNGEFEQGDLSPGKYVLALGPSQEAIFNADPVPFEIVDQDLKGLILLLHRGEAEISGQVILEGLDAAEVAVKIRTMKLHAEVMQNRAISLRQTTLAPDGFFSMQGLPSGRVLFKLNSSDFSLVQYEFNGPPGNYLLEGFPLENGQQITGLKLHFVEGKGTLIGSVRTKAGPLPENVKCYVLPEMENSPDSFFGTETDSRGMFRLEGLPPGDLVLVISPLYANPNAGPSKSAGFKEFRQRVSIRPHQETHVEIIIDLVTEKGEEPSNAERR
jgi:hypothetical protein